VQKTSLYHSKQTQITAGFSTSTVHKQFHENWTERDGHQESTKVCPRSQGRLIFVHWSVENDVDVWCYAMYARNDDDDWCVQTGQNSHKQNGKKASLLISR